MRSSSFYVKYGFSPTAFSKSRIEGGPSGLSLVAFAVYSPASLWWRFCRLFVGLSLVAFLPFVRRPLFDGVFAVCSSASLWWRFCRLFVGLSLVAFAVCSSASLWWRFCRFFVGLSLVAFAVRSSALHRFFVKSPESRNTASLPDADDGQNCFSVAFFTCNWSSVECGLVSLFRSIFDVFM